MRGITLTACGCVLTEWPEWRIRCAGGAAGATGATGVRRDRQVSWLDACWDLVACAAGLRDGAVPGEGMAQLPARESIESALAAYIDLVRLWNPFASLVSEADASERLELHIRDSLSLTPYIVETCRGGGLWLDLGSGGGFPAVPVKVVCPWLRLRMVERSGRKVGFLRQVAARIRLEEVEIVQGTFPQAGQGGRVAVVTSRAIEEPERVGRDIAAWLPYETTYLCQRESLPSRLSTGEFHAELLEDAWTERGLRRSRLWRIQRQSV